MAQTSFATCSLCEACCGLRIEHDGDKASSIRGDDEDVLSKGHICPKAVALEDVRNDPDRVLRPMRRRAGEWQAVSWDEALDEIAARLVAIQREHGPDAVGFYYGNPTAHSYGAILYGLMFAKSLGSKNIYSSNSVDALPRLLTSLELYANQALLPVPDLDRTQYLLIVGANPVVSNGSVMTAPGVEGRLRRLRQRGGKLVVLDPRRTETAKVADEHHFVRPGTDALLLAAMINVLFADGRVRLGALDGHVDGVGELREHLAPFTAERVTGVCGVARETIVRLARELHGAPAGVCYGRVGACVQRFGTLTSWLIDALNLLTGNLDKPGGAMFASPAVDLATLARLLGQTGSFDRWRSRVDHLPEFNGELPAATLAAEMETPGPGRVRALVTHAGNPVLSLPNGRRLDRALDSLELMVSLDVYVNETTRHAHFILPTCFGLERDHYPLLFSALGVQNFARYSKPVFRAPPGVRDEWRTFLELTTRIERRRGGLRRMLAGAQRSLFAGGPRRVLGWLLRMGPHGLTLGDLERAPHGVDFGRLVPQLVQRLRGRRVQLAPQRLVGDLPRLAAELDAAPRGLLLIGRRSLRSNNSWMHNSTRLVKGKDRCTLVVHPADAEVRGLESGSQARVASRIGELSVSVQVSDEIMPGVVSLPHGWGHDRSGTRLSVAAAHHGVSMNDVTDESWLDTLSGTAALNGIPVTVTRFA